MTKHEPREARGRLCPECLPLGPRPSPDGWILLFCSREQESGRCSTLYLSSVAYRKKLHQGTARGAPQRPAELGSCLPALEVSFRGTEQGSLSFQLAATCSQVLPSQSPSFRTQSHRDRHTHLCTAYLPRPQPPVQ